MEELHLFLDQVLHTLEAAEVVHGIKVDLLDLEDLAVEELVENKAQMVILVQTTVVVAVEAVELLVNLVTVVVQELLMFQGSFNNE